MLQGFVAPVASASFLRSICGRPARRQGQLNSHEIHLQASAQRLQKVSDVGASGHLMPLAHDRAMALAAEKALVDVAVYRLGDIQLHIGTLMDEAKDFFGVWPDRGLARCGRMLGDLNNAPEDW